jgi:tRNA threonylcarbamoyladenosine biosynthesis protein TsaB
MKLYIDTSSRDKIIISLDKKIFETSHDMPKGQDLLPFIDEILKKEKVNVKDINEINVNSGPGSFTSLRVGVSVANALGYTLGIKVNNRSALEGVDIKYS